MAKRKPKILVFDDDKDLLQVVKDSLNRFGFDPQATSESTKCLEWVTTFKPDVCMVDIMMPGLDGFQVCDKLRQTVATRKVPIVIMTGISDKRAIVSAARFGVEGFIVKPFSTEDVLRKLIEIVKRHRLPMPQPPTTAAKKTTEKATQEQEALAAEPPVADMADPHNESDRFFAPSPAATRTRRFNPRRERLVDRIDRMKDFPAMPFIVREVTEVMDDPQVDANMMAEVVGKDEAVVAQLLKVTNSLHYAQEQEVTNMQQAVVVLGYEEVYSLVVALSLLNSFKMSKQAAFNMTEFWKHSLCTGILARHIARLDNNKSPNDAFIGGVIHDLGKLVINLACPEEYAEAIQEARKRGCYVSEVEREFFEETHTGVGRHLARKWDLPVRVAACMANHHTRSMATIKDKVAAKIFNYVYIADTLVRACEYGRGTDFAVESIPADKFENTRFHDKSIRDILMKSFEEVDQFIVDLGLGEKRQLVETADHDKKRRFSRVLILADAEQRPVSVISTLLWQSEDLKYQVVQANSFEDFLEVYSKYQQDLCGVILEGSLKARSRLIEKIRKIPHLDDKSILYVCHQDELPAKEDINAYDLEILAMPFVPAEFKEQLNQYIAKFQES